MSQAVTELESLKLKMKATWMSGDFDRVAQVYGPDAQAFVERLALKPGERVLDVACGSGNLSFPAARRGADVTGIDIATNLIQTAQGRARHEGLHVHFEEGDAEQMPYNNSSFDVVMTMFGAMFTPRPETAAAELLRVCRPGGRVAMANWTPTGFIGRMFKTTAAHVPPPSIPSPLLWGDETTVRARLRYGVEELHFNRCMVAFRLPLTPEQTVDFFREWYGPTLRAFAALDADGQAALHRDLTNLWSEHNRATDGTTHVESEYLEVVATRG